MGVTTKEEIAERIEQGDGWYTGSHFEYSYGPARHVHAHRETFLRQCIEIARQRTTERPLRVVEVGCGDGVNLFRVRDIDDCELIGIDYNELRIGRAREAVPSARFLIHNLIEQKACPIEGGAHVLLFSHVIEHIPNDKDALRNLVSWLAPGGVMALLTPNEGCLLAQLRNKVMDRWIPGQSDHVHFYTRRSLRRLVRQSGFRILKMRGEVLTVPSYRYHMGLLRRGWGYRLLRFANYLLPGQTSGWQLAMEADSS